MRLEDIEVILGDIHSTMCANVSSYVIHAQDLLMNRELVYSLWRQQLCEQFLTVHNTSWLKFCKPLMKRYVDTGECHYNQL